MQRLKGAGAQPIFWVFLLALGIRIYAGLTTHIINPDGIHYIYQARAVYYQDWSNLTSCHIGYVSLLPFLIASVYALVPDWGAAARIVTIVFSFASLIPLYFICRRFFDRAVTVAAMLVFAMIPALVGRSADIIRDPVFWPFLAFGLLFFVRYWDRPYSGKRNLDLVLSCIFFLLGAWTRVEGIMYPAVTAFYLLMADKERRFQSAFIFLSPVFLLAGFGLLALMIADVPVHQFLRLEKIRSELLHLIENYQSIDAALGRLADESTGYLSEFLQRTNEVMWFMPVGSLLLCILEKFFYPYVLILGWGFFGCRRLLQKRPGGYFLLSMAVAFIVLYLHLINTWLIYDRFLSILIMPALLLVANGCLNMIDFLQRRFAVSRRTAFIVLAVFILAFGLGKNLRPRYEEKWIFPEIGEKIREFKEPGQLARIAARDSNAYEWVFFYANQDWPGAPCARPLIVAMDHDYDDFISTLQKEKVRFVLFSDRVRDGVRSDLQLKLLSRPHEKDFEILGKWTYEDRETFYLLMTRN